MEISLVIDDLTGLASKDTTKVEVTVRGKSGVLDLTGESFSVLMELVNGDGGKSLRRLLDDTSADRFESKHAGHLKAGKVKSKYAGRNKAGKVNMQVRVPDETSGTVKDVRD